MSTKDDTGSTLGPEEQGSKRPSEQTTRDLAEALLERAKEEGVELVGPDGLLTGLTKTVLETALSAELTDHLGYDVHEKGRGAGNARNGTSDKTVHTDIGPVPLKVPRDRAGSFSPRIVPKNARRIGGFDEAILSLYAKGLSTGEISPAPRRDLRCLGVQGHDQPHHRSGERRGDRMAEPPPGCPLPGRVHRRDHRQDPRRCGHQPAHLRRDGHLDGRRARRPWPLGRLGRGGIQALAAGAHRASQPRCPRRLDLCCDGLAGLPEAIAQVWPQADVQTCVVHLVRNTLRYASRSYWQKITTDLRKVYTAPTLDAAEARFTEFEEAWGARYPAIIRLWRDAWQEFIPFLAFPPEIRSVIYTTNAIESLNARFRRATRIRGHFPSEQAATKVLYLTIRERDERGGSVVGIVRNWKQALNVFAMHYADRISL